MRLILRRLRGALGNAQSLDTPGRRELPAACMVLRIF
jgi:hypothetical protein